MPATPPSGGGGKKLWIILGSIFGVGAILMIGCCGLAYFGFSAVTGQWSAGIEAELKQHPEIMAEFGEIESISMNISKMGEEIEAGADNKQLSFRIEGSQGDGWAHVKPDQSNQALAEYMKIETDGGKEFDVDGGFELLPNAGGG
ncbi:MAG: hypothetical protein AAFN70_14245 [Planctomycetota bacterium]